MSISIILLIGVNEPTQYANTINNNYHLRSKNMSPLISLDQVKVGQAVLVLKIAPSHPDEASRLQQLNIRRGVALTVLQKSDREPLLVAIHDARVAINYQLAQSIWGRALED